MSSILIASAFVFVFFVFFWFFKQSVVKNKRDFDSHSQCFCFCFFVFSNNLYSKSNNLTIRQFYSRRSWVRSPQPVLFLFFDFSMGVAVPKKIFFDCRIVTPQAALIAVLERFALRRAALLCKRPEFNTNASVRFRHRLHERFALRRAALLWKKSNFSSANKGTVQPTKGLFVCWSFSLHSFSFIRTFKKFFRPELLMRAKARTW